MSGWLLDTHVLLWLLTDSPRLGPLSRQLLARSDAVHASAASTWELAVKVMLGKVEVPRDLPTHLVTAGLVELPVTVEHTDAIRDVLGLTHHDPFDRLLLAQARTEGLTFLTADAAILDVGLPHVRSAQE